MRGCVVSVSAAEVDEGTWSAKGDLMDTIGSGLGVTSELVSRRRRNTLFPLIALANSKPGGLTEVTGCKATSWLGRSSMPMVTK